jgi:hypothetical protein
MKRSRSGWIKRLWVKYKPKLRLWGRLLLSWRFLLCFGLAWIITNGWSYVLFGLGMLLDNAWMIGVSSAYLAFLWLPISPEKIVTVAIACFLVRHLFPKHNKLLQEQILAATSKSPDTEKTNESNELSQ